MLYVYESVHSKVQWFLCSLHKLIYKCIEVWKKEKSRNFETMVLKVAFRLYGYICKYKKEIVCV